MIGPMTCSPNFMGTSRPSLLSGWCGRIRGKYVYNPYSEDELYDMKSDPHELHNLANHLGYKHVLRRMKARMVDRLRETRDNIIMEGGWQSNSFDLLVSERER